MKRPPFQIVRSCAFAALAFSAIALASAGAQALTRLDAPLVSGDFEVRPSLSQIEFDAPAHQGLGDSLAQGSGAELVLAGFKRSRSSFSRARSFKKARGIGSSRTFKRARTFSGPRRFSSSVASDLLRRDRAFRGTRALTGRRAALVRGSRLNSRNLFTRRGGAFRRGPFDDSRIRALRAEALALDAQARLIELGLTPAQEAARPTMSPALMRALALTKEAKAKAAAEGAGSANVTETPAN